MTPLQQKALRQAIAELKEARNKILMYGDKSEFLPVTDRRSIGHASMELIESASFWIDAVLDGDA